MSEDAAHADWLPMPYKDPEARKRNAHRYYLQHREERLAAWPEEYAAKREQYIARSRAWYANNKERAAERQKTYDNAHSEQVKARRRRWRTANRERHNNSNRLSYARNRSSKLAYHKSYRTKNVRQISAKNAEYYELNKDRIQERNKTWWYANREFAIKYQNQRRAAIRSSPGQHTAQDIKDLWEEQGHKCAVPNCRFPISDKKGDHKYHLDHVQALVNGGSNDRRNLIILCATHNLRKNRKDAEEWAKEHGVILEQTA